MQLKPVLWYTVCIPGYPNLSDLGLQSGLWLSLGLWDLTLPLGQFAAVLDHSDMQVMLLC